MNLVAHQAGGGDVFGPILASYGDKLGLGDQEAFRGEYHVTHTLMGEGHDASEDGTGRGVPLITCYRTSGNCGVMDQGDRSAALTQSTDQNAQILVAGFKGGQGSKARSDGYRIEQPPTITSTDSRTQQAQRVHISHAVRRLTPRECERLQGFPDDYTLIPYRGKPREKCPDSPRYRALGNSMAVPVMRWIGERIIAVQNAFLRECWK